MSKFSSFEKPQGGVFLCDTPSYRNLLNAVEQGYSYIQTPTDNKQGFRKTKIADIWSERADALHAYLEAYNALYELYGVDGCPSIAEKLKNAHNELLSEIVYFDSKMGIKDDRDWKTE